MNLPVDGAAAGEDAGGGVGALDWTVHPFRERQRMGFTILGVILAVSMFAAYWARSGFWGIFSFAVLFLSLESFYFPTRFVLEEKKLTVVRRFSRSEREWNIFRRCLEDRDGLTLSPFTKSSWLETYRAIRVRFDRTNREQVKQFVRDRLAGGAEWVRDPKWKQDKTAA